MAVHKSRRSILSLKSWLFTPATKADRFDRAAEVHADALIIELEDAIALPDKQKARTAALQYLGQPAESRSPCALRINAPVTRTESKTCTRFSNLQLPRTTSSCRSAIPLPPRQTRRDDGRPFLIGVEVTTARFVAHILLPLESLRRVITAIFKLGSVSRSRQSSTTHTLSLEHTQEIKKENLWMQLTD
jgi:HpcH/HpaI aldolase/citrate lyase family